MADTTTIATYDRNAQAFSAYHSTGERFHTHLIESGLEIASNPAEARVIEVGCGDGQDAARIIPRVAWYEGFDPSTGLISLARRRLPTARFVLADAVAYAYPEDGSIDVFYGFASFPHLNPADFAMACSRIHASLRVGGALVVTLKEGSGHMKETVSDEFGERTFHRYDQQTAQNLAGSGFAAIGLGRLTLKRQNSSWLFLGFKKLKAKPEVHNL